MRNLHIPTLVCLLAMHGTVSAQADPTEVAMTPAEERAAQARLRDTNQAVDLDVRTGFLNSGVLVSAGGDATNVSLSLSRSWDGGNDLSFNSGSLVLTAPITDKDRKEGAFITEGGLPNSYSLQASFNRAWVADRPLPASLAVRTELLTRARERCQIAAVTDASRTACATASMRRLEADHLTADERARIQDRFGLWMTGLSGSIGTREFEFRRLSDFAKDSVNRTEYSASAFFGYTPGSSPIYLGAGYEYRRQYRNVTARTLCPPPAVGAPLECFTASYGEPQRNVDSNVFAVARWQGELAVLGGRLPLGIELRAAYDTHDRVFGLALPIYFLSGADGLRGGVRFNWQDVDDRDERFGFRVFIGTPFHLLGS
jgi:hypothetical protein